MTRYVVDSYAFLAHYWEEPGAVRFRGLLGGQRNQFWMTVVNLGEIYYTIARRSDEPTARDALDQIFDLPIELVEVDESLALAAASLKARYALAYADCFAAALTRRLDASLITGDPEFARREAAREVRLEWLPAKPPRR